MNFKVMIILAASALSTAGHAVELKLEEFDQFKLGELLGNLPVAVRKKVVTKFTAPSKGFEVRSEFPKAPGPFKMICNSSYFGGALYPSYSKCQVTVNENHPETTQQYDEYKIVIQDPTISSALYEAIPYNAEEKEFNSHGKDEGTTFDGLTSNVFHYRFVCRPLECMLTVTSKVD
ncbi:MAG TPA: hypothetical protein VNJ01_11285 [Bacteriovoracaceae bacterium]|nr:hypothetical protein [Bacteriovoracaceae bacterium]